MPWNVCCEIRGVDVFFCKNLSVGLGIVRGGYDIGIEDIDCKLCLFALIEVCRSYICWCVVSIFCVRYGTTRSRVDRTHTHTVPMNERTFQ